MLCLKWWNAKANNDKMYSPIFNPFFAIQPFFLLKSQWKPSYCSSILSFLCFLHSGFIFLGTKAINIWRTFSIFIVYLSVSRRDQLLSRQGCVLSLWLCSFCSFFLFQNLHVFSLQECEIMNMMRAETVQNDLWKRRESGDPEEN